MPPLRYVPRPPLSDLVEFFWAFDAYGGDHARERVLPTATGELVVTLRDDRVGPVLAGAHSEAFVIDTASRSSLIGVHFKPGGALPFLKRPAHELANVRVSPAGGNARSRSSVRSTRRRASRSHGSCRLLLSRRA